MLRILKDTVPRGLGSLLTAVQSPGDVLETTTWQRTGAHPPRWGMTEMRHHYGGST
jgi:hypothetical protein